jgi:transcriptional regulator with XRE-family HTH domain
MPPKALSGRTAIPLSNLQIGGLIRATREKLGLSPATFAKMADMSQANVYLLEKGKGGFRPSTLNKLTSALLTRATSPIVSCQEASKSPIENNAATAEPQKVMNSHHSKEYRRFVQGWKAPKQKKNSDGNDVSRFNIEIGNRVKSIREMLGLSFADLARMTGMYPREIARLEKGIQGFRTHTLQRIADALGVKVAFLISGKRRISVVSVVRAPGSCVPRMPQELLGVLHSRAYRAFLMRCVEIYMYDEATFNELNTIARKYKLKHRC